MKKVILFSILLLASLVGVFTSCSSEEVSVSNYDTANSQQSLTLQQLQAINDSVYNIKSLTNSRGVDGWQLFKDDTDGAYKFGRLGSKVGAIVGGLFSGVGSAPGSRIGGAVGAVIGAIGASYESYKTHSDCAGLAMLPSSLPNITDSYNRACAITEEDDDQVKVLRISDDLEKIGKLHNITIDYILTQGNPVMALGNALVEPVEPGPELKPQPVISEFEMEVLNSEDYISTYDQFIEEISEGDSDRIICSDGSLIDDIMVSYLDVICCYGNVGYFDDIVYVTNQYIDIINSSAELTENEKDQLYIAFAVAVYSYQYWSTHYIED